MSDLTPSRQSAVQPISAAGGALDRRTAREVRAIRRQGELVTVAQVTKIETIANVTEAAMLATAHIAAVESMLSVRTPLAEERIRHIADAGSVGMANVVLRLGSMLW